MLAGSIALFWTFYSHSNKDFAKWLYQKQAFNTYLLAFLKAIAIFLVTTIALIITGIGVGPNAVNLRKIFLTDTFSRKTLEAAKGRSDWIPAFAGMTQTSAHNGQSA
jgi:hypothetical protein